MELSTRCSLAGMLNKNTGMIVEESLVLVAEVCWGTPGAHGVLEITEDPGQEPAMGAALWPHKWHKALQDPVNKEKTSRPKTTTAPRGT